jgi:Uma2 family endonuclease
MMPSDSHGKALRLLYAILSALLPDTDFIGYEVAILDDPADPRQHLMPDVFVALGAGQLDPFHGDLRDQFRLWDEHALPDLVIELSSRTTVLRDETTKRARYATMGVREYVLFDPKGTWLTPRLQVFLLQDDGQPRIPARMDGSIESAVLGPNISWVIVNHDLRLRDDRTGTLLLTGQEREMQARQRAEQRAQQEMRVRQQETQARLAAEERAQQETQARRVAEQRAQHEQQARLLETLARRAAEEELARLRAELEQRNTEHGV